MAPSTPKQRVVIIGGGVSGLTLALALHHKLHVTPTVYEQAPAFGDDVGGAIGMYANGLRVLHDISPALLDAVRAVGKPFEKRRWLRHDGSVVAVGDERFLCVWRDAAEAQRFQSIGIRRWRLQKVLYQACVAASIPVVFNERLERLEQPLSDTPVCVFASGLKVTADLLFGCDGLRSMVRASVFGSSTTTEPKYTGVTCFMGAAALPRREPGICFPSSRTTQCHAVFYPTADNEQVFQIYFPMPENIETWGTLSFEEGRRECNALADILQKDGWADEFLDPLRNAVAVIRTGVRARDPLTTWHAGRVVMLGDTVHPPVPYIGQGGMMALEDAGTLQLLLQRLCYDPARPGVLNLEKLESAVKLYEQIRIPRTELIYQSSHSLGAMQLTRARASDAEIAHQEWLIWAQVQMHGTLPIMRIGASRNYAHEVDAALAAAASSASSATATKAKL